MVELRNNKNKKLRRVSISIPGFHSVKGIKIITSALHPDKVSELQTSWSLSKDKSVLFLKEIGELPPLAEIQFYIFGDYLPVSFSAFFEPVNISLEAGSTKVIREIKVIPGLMEYPRWIRFPSLDTIFIAGIFALVWYLVFIIKRKE